MYYDLKKKEPPRKVVLLFPFAGSGNPHPVKASSRAFFFTKHDSVCVWIQRLKINAGFFHQLHYEKTVIVGTAFKRHAIIAAAFAIETFEFELLVCTK